MSQGNALQTFLTASDLSRLSQEVLRQLLEQLEHLDLTGKLSESVVDQIIQTAHGGNGDVYTAYLWIGGRKVKVALKRLRFYIYKDKDFARLLAKEIRIWARLCHPNVLELLGYILEENGFPSLISRWMGNGTALEYVRAHAEADIFPLIVGIAKGLEYLHGQDVVHSDLKSDNILISEEGMPLICDFGASRILAASQTLGGETTSDRLKGSLRWLAIEFFTEGQSKHTKESDIWAFGMTVYEMLVKDRPYYHIRMEPQVMFAIAKGEIPLLPTDFELEAVSSAIQVVWLICQRCWKADIKLRWPMCNIVSIFTSKIPEQIMPVYRYRLLRARHFQPSFFSSDSDRSADNLVKRPRLDIAIPPAETQSGLQSFFPRKTLPEDQISATEANIASSSSLQSSKRMRFEPLNISEESQSGINGPSSGQGSDAETRSPMRQGETSCDRCIALKRFNSQDKCTRCLIRDREGPPSYFDGYIKGGVGIPSLQQGPNVESPQRLRSTFTRACRECKRKKIKCDQNKPSCGRCVSSGVECIRTDSRSRRAVPTEDDGDLTSSQQDLMRFQQPERPRCMRTRAGCLTCRAKKVKCDESKPTCMRCTHATRECTWPANLPTPGKRSRRYGASESSLSLASASNSSASTSRPSTAESSSSSVRFSRTELGPSEDDLGLSASVQEWSMQTEGWVAEGLGDRDI